MIRRIIVSPTAKRDLDEVWLYVARDSIDAAEHLVGDIESAMKLLAGMPGIGHRRDDVNDSRLRFWSVHSYLIAYSSTDEVLRVARVVSGHRDLKPLFGPDAP